MDGRSMQKLIKAGYKIFRCRDIYPILSAPEDPMKVIHEIRENSSRGHWVKYGTYPTRAARERAWKELAQDNMHIMDTDLEPASIDLPQEQND